jgi:hypothetical protein
MIMMMIITIMIMNTNQIVYSSDTIFLLRKKNFVQGRCDMVHAFVVPEEESFYYYYLICHFSKLNMRLVCKDK